MSFNYATPEETGISSANIQKYIDVLESSELVTHNLIIMRHGKIVFEHYWEPFDRDFRHRMYSVTKSFVSLAIGFLEQEGKIDLDDPLEKYFPKEAAHAHEFQKKQTVRHTLMMATAMPGRNWFADKPLDRVQHYFDCPHAGAKPSGTVFNYDSEGSFILCAIVERVAGMKFTEYLREKLFDKIGVEEVDCLECPGGHSWGDSAIICRPIDLLRVAQFCMNKGEGILNEAYVTAATARQIDNSSDGFWEFDSQGYGYQFWRSYDNSFFFNGMGCQFALCIPDKDIVMVYNGDNQGNENAKKIIFDHFFDMIARPAKDPLPEAVPLKLDDLKLHAVKGLPHVKREQEWNDVVFKMEENPMGITEVSFHFGDNIGIFRYTNAQGRKELPFGVCENIFYSFPQQGYSDRVGSQSGSRLYDCGVSAAWVGEKNLFIKVQIIDTYFGNLRINVGFEGNGIGILMKKTAEDFLNEYEGFAGGARVE